MSLPHLVVPSILLREKRPLGIHSLPSSVEKTRSLVSHFAVSSVNLYAIRLSVSALDCARVQQDPKNLKQFLYQAITRALMQA